MDIIATVLGVVLLALVIGTPFYALLTNPAADRTDIKAAYEGLQGLAGPNAKVVDIRRSGIWFGGRGPPKRAYEVRLERIDGTHIIRMVGVKVQFIRTGEVTEQNL
jgi:hypothetical protein